MESWEISHPTKIPRKRGKTQFPAQGPITHRSLVFRVWETGTIMLARVPIFLTAHKQFREVEGRRDPTRDPLLITHNMTH